MPFSAVWVPQTWGRNWVWGQHKSGEAKYHPGRCSMVTVLWHFETDRLVCIQMPRRYSGRVACAESYSPSLVGCETLFRQTREAVSWVCVMINNYYDWALHVAHA
jgi:hypothetical protein